MLTDEQARHVRLVALGTAQELFKGRMDWTHEMIVLAAEAFEDYIIGVSNED